MELEKRYRELTDLLVTSLIAHAHYFACIWKFVWKLLSLIYENLSLWQYYKQTQLEAMASEKAAAEFQLEKEINRAQEAQVRLSLLYSFWLISASIPYSFLV